MGDQPIPRPLPAYRTIEIQNKCTQTSMPRVGFELMVPAFKRAKDGSFLTPRGHCAWPTEVIQRSSVSIY
jgi:hypothetical protein